MFGHRNIMCWILQAMWTFRLLTVVLWDLCLLVLQFPYNKLDSNLSLTEEWRKIFSIETHCSLMYEKVETITWTHPQTVTGSGGGSGGGDAYGGGVMTSLHKEYILEDDECPLAILMNHPPSRGKLSFLITSMSAVPWFTYPRTTVELWNIYINQLTRWWVWMYCSWLVSILHTKVDGSTYWFNT